MWVPESWSGLAVKLPYVVGSLVDVASPPKKLPPCLLDLLVVDLPSPSDYTYSVG